jgi:hypothetical protein
MGSFVGARQGIGELGASIVDSRAARKKAGGQDRVRLGGAAQSQERAGGTGYSQGKRLD